MAVQLISSIDLQNGRNLGKKVEEAKAIDAINLAQSVELYDYLGDLYFDVLDNYTEAAYKDLMDGSTFTVSGDTFIHEGVKSLLVDLAYARYLYSINTNITPHGAVTKLNQDSAPLERNMLKDLVSQIQRDADVKFIMIRKYIMLSDAKDTFKRFFRGQEQINNTSQKFSVIGRNSGSREGFSRKGYENDYYRY